MKRKRKHKRGSNTGLIVGLSLGGVALVAVLGAALYLAFGKKGDTAGGGGGLLGGPGGVIDSDNPKLTRENYEAIDDGHTAKEIEAILGNSGRKPTEGDFDHVFGKYPEELSRMPLAQARKEWEGRNAGGAVRAWKNGPLVMMVFYYGPPEKPDTRIVAKLLRLDDGGVLMMSGTGVRPEERPDPAQYSQPKPQPKEVVPKPQPKQPNPPMTVPNGPKPKPKPPSPNDPPIVITAENLLADFAADRAVAIKKYLGRKVKVTGKISNVLVSVVTFETDGGKVEARLDGVATGAISKYKVGDTITVTGTLKSHNVKTRMLMMDGCSLEK